MAGGDGRPERAIRQPRRVAEEPKGAVQHQQKRGNARDNCRDLHPSVEAAGIPGGEDRGLERHVAQLAVPQDPLRRRDAIQTRVAVRRRRLNGVEQCPPPAPQPQRARGDGRHVDADRGGLCPLALQYRAKDRHCRQGERNQDERRHVDGRLPLGQRAHEFALRLAAEADRFGRCLAGGRARARYRFRLGAAPSRSRRVHHRQLLRKPLATVPAVRHHAASAATVADFQRSGRADKRRERHGILEHMQSKSAPITLPLLLAAGLLLPGCISGIRNPSAGRQHEERHAPGRSSTVKPTSIRGSGPDPARRLIVNGDTVTVDDVINPLRPELRERRQAMPPDEYRRYVSDVAIQAMRGRVVDTILYRKASLRMSQAERDALESFVSAELRRRVTSAGNGTQHEYEKLLHEQQRTLDDEREQIRRQLTVQRYLHLNVMPRVQEPTRAELVALFERVKDNGSRPQRRRMRLIEVRLLNHLDPAAADPSRAQQAAAREAARAKIEDAYRRVRGGEAFEDVARATSEGIHAEDGGDWGWVGRDSLMDRWKAACDTLWTLEAGQTSEIVETDEGFFLVQCAEVEPAYTPDFQTLQPQLVERHRSERYNDLINELIEELIRDARFDPPDIEPFVNAVIEAALAVE
ncbi:MAG: hypothetical protein C4547_11775 [Phycisphaerales bacterium]|nr:MAG: hypothetical protein C4547_11775 [Phycisphaerales bacterium]